MLKWTVANKRDSEKRRSSVGVCTLERDSTSKSALRTKRRRSSAPRRSTDKENQFTSTPIKGSEEAFQPDVALRDVSNLTPKKSGQKKKKQKCVSPFHIQDFLMSDNSRCNYFKPFESVDSHIKGEDEEIACRCENPIKKTYAPTLPTFPFRAFNNLKLPEICQPNKKAKIDHVNDFLQQISLITSPEEDRLRHTEIRRDVNVSPLVKRLVDLRFSKIKPLEDSSFINDLSLDKIVDAILDNSNANSDNNLNQTREENFINARQEEQDNASLSTDSGFKSSTTEQSHHIDENFTCKCNNNIDKTMINLEGTYNERCVDVSRKLDYLEAPRERCVDVTLEKPRERCVDAVSRKLDYLVDGYRKQDFLERPNERCLGAVSRKKTYSERCIDLVSIKNDAISRKLDYLQAPNERSVDVPTTYKNHLQVSPNITRTINCLEISPDVTRTINRSETSDITRTINCLETSPDVTRTINSSERSPDVTRTINRLETSPDVTRTINRLEISPIGIPRNNHCLELSPGVVSRRNNCLASSPKVLPTTTTIGSESSNDFISRKRSPGDSLGISPERKRMLLNGEEDNFILRRQKCIRRRRLDEIKKHIVVDGSDNDNSFESYESSVVEPMQGTYTVENGVNDETYCKEKGTVRGTINLELFYKKDVLSVNVFRCEDLHRANGQPANAYVKVALSDRSRDGRRKQKQKGTLQRTAVQAESPNPVFDTVFNVPIDKSDLQKVLHVEVWHRDRATRRSEFLGCVSFVVKNAIKTNITGSYPLLPQSLNRNYQISPVPQETEPELEEEMCESHSSVDDVVGYEGDIDVELKKTTSKTMLSQQQKDADENLFLRYLELDPTEGPEAGPAAAQRKATGNKGNGRTPFTTTKILRRLPKTGFGFSVVWTHPPRIERVEKGLPADKAGILPGDYLIFVDQHNVVMMPEVDILNLIRSFGNQLTLEIFRRSASRNGSVPSVRRLTSFETGSSTGLPPAPPSIATTTHTRRPSTVCSTNTASVEYNRKKLHIPQVTFSSEKPTNSTEDKRKKAMYNIITREQQYATALQFAMARFVSALAERKDLIGPAEHRILFQNSDELLRITEDILDCLVQDDGDYHTNILLGTYHLKLSEISSAYKKYCSGIKKADCVLANAAKNQEFVRFLQTPAIPRRRPDLTVFIHKPLEHYREVLTLFNVILSHTKPNHEDYYVINQIVHELQVTYREMTSEAGLMEPMGEGRPLLSVQDLENRLVFTKCKPFVLAKPGRQWIFGGDLSRVEGRTVRQYWALLFTDILLFAKVSRDRVLFILEDPLPLANISDTFFNVRKKANEFRIIVEPGGGREASSPTVHCGPDLSRTPKKNPSKRCIVLRTPTVELKAVWQNLLQRQIFHVNSGMDGSSYSSPLESPEAPITSSVVTLQSAESLSFRRQSPRNVDYSDKTNDQKKQIDELIEHKCKQLEKSSSSSKSNAIHLEQWMKGQLGDGGSGGSGCGCEHCPDSCREEEEEEDGEFEVWTEDMIRKRSEELRLIEPPYRANGDLRRSESRCGEEIGSANFSDQDQSPSRSTNTTESQVTVRSSPLVPETVNVCRQCHKTCVTNQNYENANGAHCKNIINNNNNINAAYLEDEDDWRPLMLMGLTAINPAATLVKLDPFAAPVPQISVLPPTPELQTKTIHSEYIPNDVNCNCQHSRPQVGELILNKSYDNSPDDSPMNDEQPYHSLNSSNLTLRRYGTVSSLERVGSEEKEDGYGLREESDESVVDEEEEQEDLGVDNEAFNHSSILSWTARAGSYVAEKMAFFERLGEDYRASGRFFERYLKTEVAINGDDVQEEESGATSGEEIWGTPTSGGELDEPLSSPNYDGRNSPNGDSLSSSEDTELMMDELLMTPPVTGANIRGLLPRRTLEPLMEEEYSDSYTSSSASTPTDPSASPEQGNGTGDAADECSDAAVKRRNSNGSDTTGPEAKETTAESVSGSTVSSTTTIHRSESYRRIIEQEDDNVGFFTRFRNRPSMKFVNIERIPPARGAKFLEFFNVRRERKIYETFPGGKHIIKVFSKEGDDSDDVPTTYADKPESILRIKERQLDRRFWKQLSRRRSNKPVQLSA